MLSKLAKLESISYNIQMRAITSKQEAQRLETNEYLKGYRKGQQHTAENLAPFADELHQLILEIKAEYYKEYFEEDVDLSGNLGQVVDEYA